MRKDFFLTYDATSRVLAACRKRKGLSQEALGARTDIHSKTISTFETGRRTDTIKLRHILAICDAFEITPLQFFAEIARLEKEQ